MQRRNAELAAELFSASPARADCPRKLGEAAARVAQQIALRATVQVRFG
jgi:hypothetical protein